MYLRGPEGSRAGSLKPTTTPGFGLLPQFVCSWIEREKRMSLQLTNRLMRFVWIWMATTCQPPLVKIEVVFQLHVNVHWTTVSGCRTKPDQPRRGNRSFR